MSEVRKNMFPYAIHKNEDGTWTFLNRRYKQVGVVSNEWADYDDARHKMAVKLSPAKLKKLDHKGTGEGNPIFLYDDASNPERGSAQLKAYLDKLAILIAA